MIAKISNGNSFAGILDYALTNHADAEVIYADGVNIQSRDTMISSFKVQSAMRPDLKERVGHFSLDFSPDDTLKLSDERIIRLAKEYMRRMEFTNTQYLIVIHRDHDYIHCHIIYNRTDNNGMLISDRFDKSRSQRICWKMTKAHNLTMGKGKGNVNRDRLKGKDAVKYAINDVIEAALSYCHCWDDFIHHLTKKGVSVHFRKNGDGKATGIVFTKGNVSFGGGKIDKAFTYPKLNAFFQKNKEQGEPKETGGRTYSHLQETGKSIYSHQHSVYQQTDTTVSYSHNDVSSHPGIEPLPRTNITSMDNPVEEVASGIIEEGGKLMQMAVAAFNTPVDVSPCGGASSAGDDEDDEEERRRKLMEANRKNNNNNINRYSLVELNC